MCVCLCQSGEWLWSWSVGTGHANSAYGSSKSSVWMMGSRGSRPCSLHVSSEVRAAFISNYCNNLAAVISGMALLFHRIRIKSLKTVHLGLRSRHNSIGCFVNASLSFRFSSVPAASSTTLSSTLLSTMSTQPSAYRIHVLNLLQHKPERIENLFNTLGKQDKLEQVHAGESTMVMAPVIMLVRIVLMIVCSCICCVFM